MELQGKTALVTGASSGIGRATALRLGKAGASVCVNAWEDEAGAQSVVDELAAMGCDSFQHQADISDEVSVKALADSVVDRWGKIDILVNNAGISGAGLSFFDITLDVWNRMLRVNLTGMFLCSRTVLPVMMEAGYGRIVNLSSTAGISSIVASNAHYAAAKGGVIAMTRRLARDFGEHGITVNCVAPGLILDTGFNRDMAEEKVAHYVSQMPLGRPGYTADVAGMITFLASDEAGFITGQVIVADGGATC